MRRSAKTFEDLEMWQKAHSFVLDVYRATSQFPKTEMFGVAAQFRRAAVSAPANIAEGFRKRSPADKARYLNIAEGSLEECRYYCILARDLGYPQVSDWRSRIDEIALQIASYAMKLRCSP